jgi:Lipopolysaccharide-assembly
MVESWSTLSCRRFLRRLSAHGAVLCAFALLAGCGYSLAGRGSFLPESIKTIGVPMFGNNTPVFDIERRVTEKVRSELIGRGRYKVLPEATGVDGLLTGDITSIQLVPASFTDQRQASRYAIIMSARIEFKEAASGKVLWSNPSMQFREEYEVTTGVTALDPAAFFSQNTNAIERLASNFARSAVSAILEAF